MLHHLLAVDALEAPYVRRGDRATPREVLRLVRAGPPAPLERLAPDAPPELVAIASKAMAREPSERYASMRELASDLRAFLEGQVVAAYETGAWAEARKWVKRNRGLTAALGLALCSLVAGAVVAIDQAGEARASEGRALAANFELDQRNAELEVQARDLRLRGMIQELARFRAESARAGDGADMGRPSAEWWLE
jgi:cell division protein FtsB